jgi:hypothetical protein
MNRNSLKFNASVLLLAASLFVVPVKKMMTQNSLQLQVRLKTMLLLKLSITT